jgi:hypothetical protein
MFLFENLIMNEPKFSSFNTPDLASEIQKKLDICIKKSAVTTSIFITFGEHAIIY